MAENLSIESPDFDRIRKGDNSATEDAIRLLWFVANDEIATRRRGIRAATEREKPKVLSSAPTPQQDNFNREGAAILAFTGGTNFTLTGIGGGEEGDRVTLHNLGSATITLAHESGSSVTYNRMTFAAGVNKSLGPGQTVIFHYLSSRWREASFA